MESVNKVTPLKNDMPEGVAILTGKISSIHKPQSGEYDYYALNGKAIDAYSLPPVFQISHPANMRPLGREGDEITVRVKLGGYPRKVGSNTFYNNTFTTLDN